MSLSAKTRFNIFKRDGFKCVYCKSESETLQIDHKVPISKGGENTIDNLVTSCVECNYGKGSATLEEPVSYGQGKYVSVYIPGELVAKWKQIEHKSKFVQQAINNQ